MVIMSNRKSIIIVSARILLLAIMILAFSNCLERRSSHPEPPRTAFSRYLAKLKKLQKLPRDRVYDIQVAYVYDPYLIGLSNRERVELYRRTEQYTKKLLGYKVRIHEKKVSGIRAFFKEKEPAFKHPVLAYPLSWDIPPWTQDFYPLTLKAVKLALRGKKRSLLERYFGKGPEGFDQYANYVMNRFSHKLFRIYSERDSRGRTLYAGNKEGSRLLYFSFGRWSTILYQEREIDFYLTNTGIIGSDTAMPIYVINRGGVTSAFINSNGFRPLQGVGIIGLYPFLSKGRYFRDERDRMSDSETLDAIAMIWVHEFGHLLMRKAEIYNMPGSVHQAPRRVNYRDWMLKIKAKANSQSDKVPELSSY